MKVIRDRLYLCSNCTVVACNGAEGAEGADIEEKQLRDTLDGLNALGPHLAPNFNSETGEGLWVFSSGECDACHTTLAGYRARFAILGEDTGPTKRRAPDETLHKRGTS